MTMVTDCPAVAQVLAVTGGVDTHAEVHMAAAIDAVGRELGHASFATTPAGYAALPAWLDSFGPLERIGVEGTGVYGACLTRVLQAAGVTVVEVDRPDRKARRYQGKSDPIDAYAAARAALSGRASGTPKTRTGTVKMIRTLRVARVGAGKAKTVARNQLKALIKTAPAELRERLRHLDGAALLDACAGLRAARGSAPEHGPHAKRRRPGVLVDPTAACKRSLAVLARRIRALEAEIADLDDDLVGRSGSRDGGGGAGGLLRGCFLTCRWPGGGRDGGAVRQGGGAAACIWWRFLLGVAVGHHRSPSSDCQAEEHAW